MTKTGGTWDAAAITDFRRAFAELRDHPLWGGYRVTAGLLGYKSARGLRWAAGEYHSDGWPGSNRLAAQLREIYEGIFTWMPPCKTLVAVCPVHGEPHVADCHGLPVAAVVALAPGQRVARDRKPPQVRALSDYPPAVLAWKLTHREPMEAIR